MATVVLGAAGAAVGGAAGRAIGSFLGRQIDRSFGRGASGRRVSDVRLPSAQYGDPIPRVLRRMRVAGLLLWASPPVLTATVSKSGTGQGSSVSFAYALSTGQVDAIGRIWADGRLIRDAEGQQAVTFSMRLHSGNEDQPRDPLLASVIGVDRTPAYRGLAYLVFENFDLSSFGNRLPLITVELASESEALSVLRVIGTHLDVPCEENDRGRPLEGLALSGDDQAIALSTLR